MPHAPGKRAILTLVAILAVVGLVVPSSSNATTIHHRHDGGGPSSTSQQPGLDEISTKLAEAQALLDNAHADLASEQRHLTILRTRVSTAERALSILQIRLATAVVHLRRARSDVGRGRTLVADKRSALIGYAVSAYESGGLDVYMVGVALDSTTAVQAVDGMQDVHVALNARAVDLQRLQALQALLTVTEQRVQAAKSDVSRRRRQAGENLARYHGLEVDAIASERAVATRVANLRAYRERLASAKSKELVRLESTNAGTTIHPNPGYLSYPVVNAFVTSPYGMRMHPILHVWELHDGTDLSANCGAPIFAADTGTVTREYFNAGYGNRLMLANGHVDGIDLATSYNHLSSFVAAVGQHVARGQLIAHAGMTGYATGCHLHFMVYVNGDTVDPMTWL